MQKPKLNYLKIKNVPILQQLQLEEALLRTDSTNWCLINEGSPPAIVMGISGKADSLIHFELLNKNPIPVIRRFSGGGTVVVDEQTIFITLICNSEAIKIPSFPNQILCWNGNLYKHPLRKSNFKIAENDYAIGHKKFGGNAQYICKGRWLHHSTLLWDYTPERMSLLKMPQKTPAYREDRTHEDFLCRLDSILESKSAFYQDFISSLSNHFQLKPVSYLEAASFLERPHRKSTTLIS